MSCFDALRPPLEALLQIDDLREDIGACAYGVDLLSRLSGLKNGAASLVLWRSFAWTSQGSPKKGFKLSAEMILNAETALLERLQAIAADSN